MAKASGILLCVAGVVVLALYQGPQLKSMNHHQLLQHHVSAAAAHHSNREWALGIFLMTTSVVIWSLWTVKQGPLLLEYPSKLLNTTLQCAFASVQSLAIALALERDFSRWKLAGPVSLASVLFTVRDWINTPRPGAGAGGRPSISLVGQVPLLNSDLSVLRCRASWWRRSRTTCRSG